jgi:hypothetical protein
MGERVWPLFSPRGMGNREEYHTPSKQHQLT